MARRVGISRTTLAAVEAGDPAPSIGTYLRVMAVLGIGGDLALLAGDVMHPAWLILRRRGRAAARPRCRCW
jgi:DNA-binding XRE family transcriptional regulator